MPCFNAFLFVLTSTFETEITHKQLSSNKIWRSGRPIGQRPSNKSKIMVHFHWPYMGLCTSHMWRYIIWFRVCAGKLRNHQWAAFCKNFIALSAELKFSKNVQTDRTTSRSLADPCCFNCFCCCLFLILAKWYLNCTPKKAFSRVIEIKYKKPYLGSSQRHDHSYCGGIYISGKLPVSLKKLNVICILRSFVTTTLGIFRCSGIWLSYTD